jgi:hypothetical protein
MSSDNEDVLEPFTLFQEPEDFYPPEKPHTYSHHKLLSGEELQVRLVGHNPLWVRPSKTSNTDEPSPRLTAKPGPSVMERISRHSRLSGGARGHPGQG